MSLASGLIGANAGARLDRLPMSRWHYKLVALVTAGVFVDLFELYSGGSILAALVQDGWSTMEINATFLSVTFVGLVIGSWLAGVLGDRYGRRFCYQLNLAIFGVASVAAAFAPNMTVLIWLRFVMGLGLGAEVVVGYATLAEFLPAQNRGRWIAMMALVANFSSFVSLSIAYYVIPAFGWRYMFAIPGIAALLIWLARKSMPESPRWLESAGRTEEAGRVLAKIELEVAKSKSVPEVATQAPLARTEPVSSAVLFSRPVIRRTLIGILINITIGFTLYGFLQWLPTIFVKQGMTMTSALQIVMVMSIGKTVGAAVGMVLADWAGRKPTIVIFALLSAFLSVGLAFAHDQTFVLMSFVLAVALGVTNTISFTVYVPELFETRYRLRGTGLCGASGRLATSGVQFLVVYLYANGGLPSIIAMLVGLLVLEAIAVYFFGPETKQVSLEEAASKDPDSVPEQLSIVPNKS
jgi:MFS transporter, putative metabolite:H+ symporter